MNDLNHLLEISEDELCTYGAALRRKWDGCLFSLGLVLLAAERRKLHVARHISSVVRFAVRVLGMDGHKASELLRVMKALLELPLLAEDFRSGELSWGKMRELTRVATPKTEEALRDYAREHSTDEVQRHISMSPKAFKQAAASKSEEQGSQLPLSPAPLVSSSEPKSEPKSPEAAQTSCPPADPQPPDPPDPNHSRLIKLVHYLTPEEFARWERAEDYIRQKRGKRMKRNEILMELTKLKLASASPDTLARLPIVVRVDAQSGKGWYDTRAGLQPATREEVERAFDEATEILVMGPETRKRPDEERPTTAQGMLFRPEVPKIVGRRRLPRSLVRAILARSGGRCECCGGDGPYHFHHKKPLSRGGGNRLEDVALFCIGCHGTEHAEDFATDPVWSRTRSRRQAARRIGHKRGRGLPSRGKKVTAK